MPNSYAKLPVEERRAKWREAACRRRRKLGARPQGSHATPDAELDTRWKRDALCKGLHPDLFHPERGEKSDTEIFDLCRGCPVRAACADYALRANMAGTDLGVWGGTTTMDRRAFRSLFGPKSPGRGVWTDDDLAVLFLLADLRRRSPTEKRRMRQIAQEDFSAERDLMLEERALEAKIAELTGDF